MTIDPGAQEPCPCFLYEDDGEDEERCTCGPGDEPHMMDEHESKGGVFKACTVGHRAGCLLDHGTDPCPEPDSIEAVVLDQRDQNGEPT